MRITWSYEHSDWLLLPEGTIAVPRGGPAFHRLPNDSIVVAMNGALAAFWPFWLRTSVAFGVWHIIGMRGRSASTQCPLRFGGRPVLRHGLMMTKGKVLPKQRLLLAGRERLSRREVSYFIGAGASARPATEARAVRRRYPGAGGTPARGAPAQAMRGSAGEARFRLLFCGVVLGVGGLLLFGTIHAIAIVPIWSRLLGGLPFAIAAGLALGWAYHECWRSASPAPGVGTGLRFGALVWLVGLPATALANGMRLLTPQWPLPWWVDVASLGLAALGGAALLWGLARTRRGALAGAIALGVLLAAGGGPVPVVNGGRAIGLWGGFFVLEAVGGAILALLYARLVAPVLPIVGPVVNAAGSGQGPAA